MPGTTLFSLLGTRLEAGSQSPVPGSLREWTSFSSELQNFLSAFYAQPDSSPQFTDPSIIEQQLRSRCQKRVTAVAYASLVILVQELATEYVQRFKPIPGGALKVTVYNGGLVLYRTGDVEAVPHPSAANAEKGFVLLKPGASESELFDAIAALGGGYAWVTNLERSYFCKLASEDPLLVADAAQATLFEALFFLIHLVFQGALAARNHKRKFTAICDEEIHQESSSMRQDFETELREFLIPPCRMLGFSFNLISEMVCLRPLDVSLSNLMFNMGDSSIFKGTFKGERALVKTYSFYNLHEMIREVWVMRKLESLRVDVVPRLLAAGKGNRWCIVMEDVLSSDGGENEDTEKKRHVEAARSALRVLHLANVVHNEVSLENFVVGKGGKVFWINLHHVAFYEDDDPDEFMLLALADDSRLESSLFQ